MSPYLCIPLHGKRGGAALVSELRGPLVAGYRWYQTVAGYAFSPKVGLMHRRVVAVDSDEVVDHKNFNRLDNRIENLRYGPPVFNNQHCAKRDTPWPYKGVRRQAKSERWQARITVNRKSVYLGTFNTAEEAARAYDAAARLAFGTFAHLNFGRDK